MVLQLYIRKGLLNRRGNETDPTFTTTEQNTKKLNATLYSTNLKI